MLGPSLDIGRIESGAFDINTAGSQRLESMPDRVSGSQQLKCKGIDLTHPRWILARAIVGNDPMDRLIPADQGSGPEWPTEPILDRDRGFWESVNQRLSLDDLDGEIPEDIEERVRPAFPLDGAVDRSVFALELALRDLYVAFAIPYQTSPMVRRSLRHLFGTDLSRSHPREKRSVVEAPIALAIESVARRVSDPGSLQTLLFLTGVGATMELTALTIVQESTLLRIEVKASTSIDPSDIAGTLRHFPRSLQGSLLVHAGDAETASRLVAEYQVRGDLSSVDLGPHAVAVGAIRHGGLLNQQLWTGGEINTLEVVRTSPVALGVIGTNRHGDWFWRRVLEKGVPITKEPTLADLEPCTSAAERIAVAECRNPDFAHRRWLSREDWKTAGLRWYEVILNPEPPPGWVLQLSMVQIHRKLWKSLPCPAWKLVALTDLNTPPTPDPSGET